ncbi:MAG: hypothetical protein AB7O96_03375 [Pseudobdellovibrionaceae bacterium]
MRDPEFKKMYDQPLLLKEALKMMFESFQVFSEKDYDDMVPYFQWLWDQKNKHDEKKKLILILRARQDQQLSQRKIEITKELELLNQLQK